MVSATIVGHTSLFAEPTHQVELLGARYSAELLAHSAMPGPLSAMAAAPVLQCLECGGDFSANDLYLDSPVPGECLSCAAVTQRVLLSA